MCGIVGLVSAYKNGLSIPEWDSFVEMLYIDTFRGFDSTGMFLVENNGNVTIKKKAVPGYEFLQHKDMKDLRSDSVLNGRILVGHNRAATRGEVVDKNAHPFCVDDKIVLVHNGSFWGSHKHLKDTDVDSEAIAHVLAEEPDVAKALNKIHSAYALVWWNTETNSLNLVRNDHRPLYVVHTNSGAFLFASEKETLDYVISKRGWKVKDDPYMLKEDTLVTIELDKESKNTSLTNTDLEIKTETRLNFPVSTVWAGSPNSTVVEHPAKVLQSFREILPDYAPQYLLSPDEGEKVFEEIKTYMDGLTEPKHTIVEAVDYVNATPDRPGKEWWVHGTILEARASRLGEAAVYWIVRDKTELEVMELVAKRFYRVNVGSTISTMFMAKDKEKYCYITILSFHPVALEQPQQYAA